MFKPGDRVRCLKSFAGSFTAGKIYTVIPAFDEYDQRPERVAVVEADHGRPDGWAAEHFERTFSSPAQEEVYRALILVRRRDQSSD